MLLKLKYVAIILYSKLVGKTVVDLFGSTFAVSKYYVVRIR